MKSIHVKHLLYVLFALLMVAYTSVTAVAQQSQNVKGVVIDENGEPIIGASVFVVGTNNGVITDIDGNFEINAVKGNTFRVSYIGFKQQDLPFRGQPSLRIVLEQEATALDEVVVVGYGTMTRKEMTSAISHVSADNLNQVTSLDSRMLLQGKVSGVSVTNTAVADPNSQGSIQIRGVSSRSAGTGPLYVIDGIPGGDMTNINPADIESIDVLKDGAASAIYGTRGSNGVILVNLKKGTKDGSVHTSYSASFTMNVAKRELEVLSADQYRDYRCILNPLADKGASTDWFDAATQIGMSHMHTLTLSGGNAKTNYRITADFRDAEGLDLRSDRMEYGARANISHTTKEGLFTFTASITPRIIKRNLSDGAVYRNALTNNPTYPIYDENSKNGFFAWPNAEPGYNVIEQMSEEISMTEIKLLEWNASAAINLLPLFNPKNDKMTLKSVVSISQNITDKFGGSFTPSTYAANINNAIRGNAKRSYDNSINTNLEWVTNFSTKIQGHQIRAMAGYSWNYGVSSGMAASNQNFDSDVLTFNNLGAGLKAGEDGLINMSSYKNDHTLISFFARVNYDWKERYMISASLRYEGSSRFGANHKWGYFPAVSAGWRISDEPWMEGASSWLDDLKVRYDYGVTGNQDFGNYISLSTYGAYGYYEYEGERFKVWGPGKNVNPNLRWEKGHNQNIGVDFSLLNYRITGSLNYFIRKQSDLLGEYDVSLPPNLFPKVFANVGTMRNQGFEFDLTFNAVRKDNFNWDLTVVGATNDNKFMSFSNDIYQGQKYYSTCSMDNPNNPGYLQRIEEGQRVGNYFTFRYAGVDNNGDWLIFDKNNNIIPVAQGVEEDKSITGNGLPVFTGSITSSFRLYDFDFSFSLRGAAGFEIFNVHDFYYGLQSMNTNLLKSAYSRNAHITTGKNVVLDYFLEPGDYLKIDNVTLGYNLKLNRRFIDKIRFFFNASNLYTFTKFTGIDPSVYEVNGLTPGTFGGSSAYYPSAFQFVFGLQVGF